MSDLTVENRVVVRIFGEDYPITGENDPKYISRIADLVDSRMKEVSKLSRSHARDKVAILAAMSIASELHEKGSALQVMEAGFQTRLDTLLGRLDEALQQDSAVG
ncbi:MAG: cell division protein ZapA [candidate division Zixibacteria bacterium]|jgi:cell division protein ZapA|nr:cell division protein ZapA [candidate division Zixibacteria bacterium]